jgi:hypothetical protein
MSPHQTIRSVQPEHDPQFSWRAVFTFFGLQSARPLLMEMTELSALFRARFTSTIIVLSALLVITMVIHWIQFMFSRE